MPGVKKEQIARAKEWDLLSYLRIHEPQELKRCGGNEYCTVSHDSLKISNGRWHWHSQGIGGDIISRCIGEGILYESRPYKTVSSWGRTRQNGVNEELKRQSQWKWFNAMEAIADRAEDSFRSSAFQWIFYWGR